MYRLLIYESDKKMAHIQKHKRHEIGHLLNENRRAPEAMKRENVDASRTHLNVCLVDHDIEFINDKIRRHEEIANRKIRKDAVVLTSIVTTLPINVPQERELEFFRHVHDFCVSITGGPTNCVSSFIHRDETTSHLHFNFTPVIQGKFNSKKMVDREFYRKFHSDCADYVEDKMGFRSAILREDKYEKQINEMLPYVNDIKNIYKREEVKKRLMENKELLAEGANFIKKQQNQISELKEEIQRLAVKNQELEFIKNEHMIRIDELCLEVEELKNRDVAIHHQEDRKPVQSDCIFNDSSVKKAKSSTPVPINELCRSATERAEQINQQRTGGRRGSVNLWR